MGIEGYYEDCFDVRSMETQTNYDRIRNMSVDEMAEWLGVMAYCNGDDTTVEEYKQWLESEVRE